MPVALPNTTTADTYPNFGAGGAQVAGTDRFANGFFVVANAAAFGQYFHGAQGQSDPSPEIFLPPGTYPLTGTEVDPVTGIRFRSGVVGTPAQVFGAFFYPNETSLVSSAEFTATVSPSGGITPPVTGGAMQLITSQVLAIVTASFDTNVMLGGNIPATFNHLQFIVIGRGDTAAVNVPVKANFNGDVAANYAYDGILESGAAVSSNGAITQSSITIGSIAAATANDANSAGIQSVLIPQYAGTVFNKLAYGNGGENHNAAGTANRMGIVLGVWKSTVAISRIVLTPNAGNFIAGSAFYLYGIT